MTTGSTPMAVDGKPREHDRDEMLSPNPPHSPGTPRLVDLDVPEPDIARETPGTQDVRHEAGAVEPPD